MTAVRKSVEVDTRDLDTFVEHFSDMASQNEILAMVLRNAAEELRGKPQSWPMPIETWMKIDNGYKSKAPNGMWALIKLSNNRWGKPFGKWDDASWQSDCGLDNIYVTQGGMDYTPEEIVELFRKSYARIDLRMRVRVVK